MQNADFHLLIQRSLGRLALPRTALPVFHRFGFGASGLRAAFKQAGLETVAVINSPTTVGDPYAELGRGASKYLIALIKAAVNSTAPVAAKVSGGRLLLASSLLTIGRKPTSRRTVLHIITRLDRGGSAESTYRSALGLVREGFQVLLVHGPDSVMREEVVIPTVSVPRLVPAVSLRHDLPAFLHLYRLIRRIRPTIVHTHTSKGGTLGRAAARLAGVPVIVHTPHGHVFYGYFGRIKTALFISIERFLARFTDRIITLTPRGAQEHVDFGIGPAEKFVPIPSGIDLEEVRKRGAQPLRRETLGIPADALLVGSAGRLVPVKGYFYLVHAAAKVLRSRPEVHFIVFGDGPEREALLREIKRIGISKNFQIQPPTDNLPAAIAAMDLFVLPSLNEGMGRVLLEAMALGKACVATRAGGIPDVVQDHVTGILVPSRDADSLASSILYLLEHPEVRERMGNEGKRRVEEGGFSEEEMVSKIVRLYREVLAEKGIT